MIHLCHTLLSVPCGHLCSWFIHVILFCLFLVVIYIHGSFMSYSPSAKRVVLDVERFAFSTTCWLLLTAGMITDASLVSNLCQNLNGVIWKYEQLEYNVYSVCSFRYENDQNFVRKKFYCNKSRCFLFTVIMIIKKTIPALGLILLLLS